VEAPNWGAGGSVERLIRRALLVVAAAAAAWCWSRYGSVLRDRADRLLYPAIKPAPTVFSLVIEEESLRRKRASFAIGYRRVFAMLEAARGQGLNVSALEPKMSSAAAMAKDGNFDLARRLLNAIEVQIPRAGQGGVRAATEQDMDVGRRRNR